MRKRLFSFVISLSLIIVFLPLSGIKSSAAFSGALQFDANGKFTIMQVADIQTNTSVPTRVINAISSNINRYHPDLVVFTGDNIIESISSVSNFQSAVNAFLAPLISTNTKFAVTFGNHDNEGSGGSLASQYAYYGTKGGSLFIDHDISALTGDASGVIPIYPYGHTSGTPAYDVYVMDSGHSPSSGKYDGCYTNQVDYYCQRSQNYPNVPSIWFQHVIVPDIYTRCMTTSGSGTSQSGQGSPFNSNSWYINPSLYNAAKSSSASTSNTYKEGPCPPNLSVYESTEHRSSSSYGSKTLYEAWRDYGNLKGAYFGHDHLNEFTCTTADGIDLGYGESTTLYKAAGIISYNDDNPGCSIYQLDINGTYTTTYSAEGEILKAMIAFDANGGLGTMKEQLVTKSSLVTLSSNAFNRTGYTFIGWNTAADGSGTSHPNGATFTVGTADLTLYAQWTASTVNITFNANGGSGSTGPTAMVPGDALTAPTVTRPGYNFTGWSPSPPPTVPTVDTTFTAQWTIQTHTLSFNANGGSGSMSSLTDSDNGVTVPPCTFTNTGHTYSGWNTAANGSGISYTPGTLIHLTGNLTLYAQWVANTYTVTYNGNGSTGGSTASSLHTYGVAMNLTANGYSRVGYTYLGWSTSSGATSPTFNNSESIINLTTTPNGVLTFYAVWHINSYTMTFDANGGLGSTSSSKAYGTQLTTPVVTREGYTFDKWLPTVPSTVPGNNETYVAQWTLNSYLISFDANGGTGGTSGPMAYDSDLTPPAVARIGYTFMGWEPEVPPSVPASDAIYTAQWIVSGNNLTLSANGGMGGTSVMLDFGSPILAPVVSRSGYIFTGWNPALPSTVVGGINTYDAQWLINNYQVTFDSNGGHGGSSTLMQFGSQLTVPTVSRTGFTLTGWLPTVPTTVPSNNAIYIAQWSRNQIQVTFDANGGVGGISDLMTFGDDLVPPAVSRTGYIFTGWSPAVPTKVVAGNQTYTAQWMATN